MSVLRRRIVPTLLALSIAATLSACAAGEPVTGATGGIQLTDTQRASVAQHLLIATQSSGEGSMAATFAAAAIVAGAEVRTVSGGQLAAIAGSRVRGNVTVGTTATYFAVAAQVIATGSPELTSVIVAWRNAPDGTPSDFVLTLAVGSSEASFAATEQSAAGAFGIVYAAPSAWWTATAGTTSLRRTSTGGSCRDIDARLAASGYRGTCHLALFDGSVNISASQRAEVGANSAEGSTVFSLADAKLGGVVIEVTAVTAD